MMILIERSIKNNLFRRSNEICRRNFSKEMNFVKETYGKRFWVDRLRPVIGKKSKLETQQYIRRIKEENDWKTYRNDFKNPRRKGNVVMQQVRDEELKARSQKYTVPDFRAGDAIEMELLFSVDSEKRQFAKGLVLGRVNRGVDSSVLLYCVVANTPHIRSIPFYSPLVQNVRIIERNFLHKGKKRARRAKLYYLIDQQKSIRAP
mmetsp:Transcript_8670/g.13339  ORF Transcript_8670/g.13339 Transcript_8670/m.13339 type:complete len:205 (-) Transcript_8670:1085-1699(-)